ncbi:uncharacterized protein LOC113282642 isoform X2 [Papaver somniferum]|uniref:uncharacterized protein LOC113282642 isoform X2 n=1 Tax=Papaver somniferum TaxID=3469 RepID=UPI000E703592|nr:uncharacterized protein LOC113282642 isoform X2 [Papaver somniferum]
MSKEQISELEARIDQLEDMSKLAREQAQFNGFKLPFNPSFPQETLEETDKKRVETLIKYYDEVIGMDPENVNHYAGRAAAHMDLRNWNAAKTDLGRVVELRPDIRNVYTNFYFGIIDFYLGNSSSAIKFLDSAVRQSEHQQVVPNGWQGFSDEEMVELKALIWNNSEKKRRSESIRKLRDLL